MRWPSWLTANRSLPSASAVRMSTRTIGSQSSWVEVRTATVTARIPSAPSATISAVDLFDIEGRIFHPFATSCRGSAEIAALQYPPELDQDPRVAQARARGFLEAPEPVPQCV